MPEASAPDSELQPSEVFVGRKSELSELRRALDEAIQGRGRLYLISGEPGIGKSRLADELASSARQLSVTVLWGRAWEDAGAPPYWMWVQAIRAYLRAVDPDTAGRQLGSRAGEIAQMVPEVRDVVPDLPPPEPIESDAARFQLFDSTAEFLRAAAHESPLAIILDDLQAADTASLLFLRFIASQLADARILILGTYRDVELTEEHPLRTAVAELVREPFARLIHLAGLPEGALGEYIQAAAGIQPGPQLVAAMHKETGGNPLFVGEAIRLLAAEGRLDMISFGELRIAVPAGIRDVIIRRLRHVDEESVKALTVAAVLGPEFGADVLCRIGGYSTSRVLALLESAGKSGLILPASGIVGRYRFTHDLVRETLYGSLSAVERVALHKKTAETLAELYGADPDSHLAELAHHYFEAAQGAEAKEPDAQRRAADEAASFAQRAAGHALRSLAFEEAARLYTMALAVLEQQASGDGNERAEILLALGDAQARSGDLPSARGSFMKAAELARRLGSGEQLARAAVGYGGRFLWPRAGDDPHLIPLLQDALVMLGGADDRLRVVLLVRLACAWRDSAAHRDQSAALSQQAVEMARAMDDPNTLCKALVGRYGAVWWPDNATERLAIAEELLALAQSVGDAERISDGHLAMLMTYADLGRMTEARASVEMLARTAADLRQPAQRWLANASRTSFALLSGDYVAAEAALALESEPGHPATPVQDDVSGHRLHRFLLARERGGLEDEEDAIRDAAAKFPWYPVHRVALTCLLADTGRLEEARAVFRELAANGFVDLVRDNEWLLTMGMACDAARAVGDTSAAAALYEQLLPHAGAHAVAHVEGSVGAIDRYLGIAAEMLGQWDVAERHYRAAISANEALGAHPWSAHTMTDLAAMLGGRAMGDDLREAVELRDRALGIARRLGMTRLSQRLAGEEPAAPTASEGVNATDAELHREGDYWSIRFGARPFRMKDMKGLHYLAVLVARPGAEVHVLDLAALEATPTRVAGTPNQHGLSVSSGQGAGPILDPHARAEYRKRLEELAAELAEAERWNDPERAAGLRREVEAITEQLVQGIGLGGRDRTAASAAERARVSVTRAIQGAFARIEKYDRDLHAHLRATVRTGTYCSYQPDPRAPLNWRVW